MRNATIRSWGYFRFRFRFQNVYIFCTFTVKLTKPWTPEIFMECYCVARDKPIYKVQDNFKLVISLWFWGLFAYPSLYCDWPVHNQHSWNFSGVPGFLSLTVTDFTINIKYISLRTGKRANYMNSERKNVRGENVACSRLWSLSLFHCPISGKEIYIKLKQTRKIV